MGHLILLKLAQLAIKSSTCRSPVVECKTTVSFRSHSTNFSTLQASINMYQQFLLLGLGALSRVYANNAIPGSDFSDNQGINAANAGAP